MSKPIVAILGRPNVGKSTLFNRLTGGRTAIVEDTPGVTRDRLYRDAEWQGKRFTLIDTGGLDFGGKEESISHQVKRQAEIALQEADVLLFVVDGRTGLMFEDELIAHLLRKSKKPVILVVNKIESFHDNLDFYEFYRLGLGDPLPISAEHGLNIGDLLDLLIKEFAEISWEEEPDYIKIAVVGRPNVGKSSLVNVILGEERVIVSSLPGTTRDAIDSPFHRQGQDYLLIDTAGMRRKGKIVQKTERFSVNRALKSIERCDVVLIILDALEGVTEQDQRIAGYVHEAGKGAIIVVNKWDLVEKERQTMAEYQEKIRRDLSFMTYAPILFVSAFTKQRVMNILEMVNFVEKEQHKRVKTSVLNEVISEAVLFTPPPTYKGRRLKIYYCAQVGIKPPHFVFFINDPQLVHFSYWRYLENKLRENFGFEGVALRLTARKREE
ncbi:MAG TPA: ribosome biogenesis GTPase Der [Clostridia bacterium]|nr:ribosome biogenesis GTPase Der [Clostridia bacterium]